LRVQEHARELSPSGGFNDITARGRSEADAKQFFGGRKISTVNLALSGEERRERVTLGALRWTRECELKRELKTRGFVTGTGR
jgi:hypothetical protein